MKKLLTSVALLSALGVGSVLVPVHAQVGYGNENDMAWDWGANETSGLYDGEFGVQSEGGGFDSWYGDSDVGFGGEEGAGAGFGEEELGYGGGFGEQELGFGEEEGYGTGFGGGFGEAGAGYGEGLGWQTDDANWGNWYGDTGQYWGTYDDVGDGGWFDI
jgi:hypothetical protein